MSHKFLFLALVLALTLPLAPASAQDKIVLKAGHVVDENHPYHHGLTKLSELLQARTNGKISIDVYHSSQLGGERALVESMQMGTVDMAATASAPVTSFLPEMTVYDLPFLFTTREHAYKVMDGPIGQEMLDKLKTKGLIPLGYFENGFRQITNNVRPITKPEDLKNIKIRVMESKAPIATFRALGANPTPMAWGEVFTALQQNTIDAQENPLTVIYGQRVYEVQKYLSMTRHFYSPSVLMISQITMNRLSPEEQKIMLESAAEAITYERGISEQQDRDFLDLLKKTGIQVVEDLDYAPFVEATKPVYDEFKQYADLIKRIQEAK
jgi:tripartite ATP-independent transporter DctP family solute receptor